MAELLVFAGFLFILAIGGFIADYIFPRIKPLMRYIDTLPLMEEDFDTIRQEETRYEQAKHHERGKRRRTGIEKAQP